MRIGVIGSGAVGQALGKGFAGLGHEVMLGSRNPEQARVVEWVRKTGNNALAGTFAETAMFGDLIVFAVLGTAAEDAIRLAGSANFSGKVVIDATNALESTPGGKPILFVGRDDSLSERIQRAIPDAHVVKAFNTVGAALMVHPQLPGGPPDMFICGNDAGAKRTVTEILQAFGWGSVDIGEIDGARYLEPMAMVWILAGVHNKNWNQAFKLLCG
jgi:8-hydroxy-5-deazaflavin:NADPH oxidoreductase